MFSVVMSHKVTNRKGGSCWYIPTGKFPQRWCQCLVHRGEVLNFAEVNAYKTFIFATLFMDIFHLLFFQGTV